jgi:hypothetical protein
VTNAALVERSSALSHPVDGEAEVEDLDLPVRRDLHVRRLQVYNNATVTTENSFFISGQLYWIGESRPFQSGS